MLFEHYFAPSVSLFRLIATSIFICLLCAFIIPSYFMVDEENEETTSQFVTMNPDIDKLNGLMDKASLDCTSAPEKGHRGFGEMGEPVTVPSNLNAEEQSLVQVGWDNFGYNVYISNLISTQRSLPDYRSPLCKESGRYLSNLPITSVIICFHNEAWSVLLRTVHSVLNHSPSHLLKEVILVDDFSNMIHLKGKLEKYFKPCPKVKIIRAAKREGLIRARLLGVAAATGEVLTFLDAHCECTDGWLEPLLDRIARNPNTVSWPVVNTIYAETLNYVGTSRPTALGGFNWRLEFIWEYIRESIQETNPSEPVQSPTMPGGLFAIHNEFFKKLGTYDEQFDIWGAENLELSFKTWMCGGILEVIPCSHVGHIYRNFTPYKWPTHSHMVIKHNSVRLAKVWLDDYAKHYYDTIGNELGYYGDITSRQKLRQELGCKSFKWYLENIYPELIIPKKYFAYGEIRFADTSFCIDSLITEQQVIKPIGIMLCHGQDEYQHWVLTADGEIQHLGLCLSSSGTHLFLSPCSNIKKSDVWIYEPESGHLYRPTSGACLTLNRIGNMPVLVLQTCTHDNRYQKILFQYYYLV